MPPTAAKAGCKAWIGLAVLILPVLLVSMDITVLYFALPSINADLHPTSTQQLWMIDIYGFILAALLITMGGIGDRIGRRRLLIIGTILFGAASVLAAFSGSPETLIIARALQGVGGATLMPSTLGLIRSMFNDAKQRRTAIAVWTIGMGAGSALGPVFSGLLLNWFWWGSIFLVNLPFVILLLLLAPAFVPEYRAEGARLNFVSALLSLTAVLPIVWGCKELAVHGASLGSIAAIAVGLVLGAMFLRRQVTHANPMIDLNLFRTRGFGPAISMNLVVYFTMVGFGIYMTQYLMEVLRMSPLEAALWTMASPIGITITGPLVAYMVGRMRPAYVIAIGFAIAASGCFMMTRLTLEKDLPLIVAAAVCMGCGVVMASTVVTDWIVGTAPAAQSGRISALLQTAQELGAALGIAVLGTIGAAVFGRTLAASIPSGLPQGTVDAAQQTLGGALNSAVTLPEPERGELVRAAQEAFVASLSPALFTAAGVLIAAAIFALVRLHHITDVPNDADADDEVEPPAETGPAAAAAQNVAGGTSAPTH
ncbi:MFS transporter [Amycolatopsis sp. WAC 01416]|uniref:MFS transporter n=1 Tax=Amycolatopsis sp. WAC 01416 TaxID=2203196 RepID=UPI000F78B397|nr:MFS transporter [Amycolatopsis sp. WAC 01416]RSN34627.1 MFS transporter [Amycolatopsis sp. WAC 01416]